MIRVASCHCKTNDPVRVSIIISTLEPRREQLQEPLRHPIHQLQRLVHYLRVQHPQYS